MSLAYLYHLKPQPANACFQSSNQVSYQWDFIFCIRVAGCLLADGKSAALIQIDSQGIDSKNN